MLWDFSLGLLGNRPWIYFHLTWTQEDELPETQKVIVQSQKVKPTRKVKAGEGDKPTPNNRVKALIF